MSCLRLFIGKSVKIIGELNIFKVLMYIQKKDKLNKRSKIKKTDEKLVTNTSTHLGMSRTGITFDEIISLVHGGKSHIYS